MSQIEYKTGIIPALSLTEMVDQYMILSFNDRRKYFANYLVAARWAWKRIFIGTLWQVVHKYVPVDKTTVPYSIAKPKDMLRFINVSRLDSCNNMQALSIDHYKSILSKPSKGKKCSCHKGCDCEDALCDAIDSIVLKTKDIEINGDTYTEKIWTKRCDNGDLIEIREVPVRNFSDEENYTIDFHKTEKLLCKLEVRSCGCIKPTEENKTLLITHCGCFMSACIRNECSTPITKTDNKYGSFTEGNDGRIYLHDFKDDWAIISFQTNGECAGEEIMVPDFAFDALTTGITFYATAFRTNVPPGLKNDSERRFNNAIDNLQMFINPIRLDAFIEAEGTIAKWPV